MAAAASSDGVVGRGKATGMTAPATQASWKVVSARVMAVPRAAGATSRCTKLSNPSRGAAIPAPLARPPAPGGGAPPPLARPPAAPRRPPPPPAQQPRRGPAQQQPPGQQTVLPHQP